MFPTTHEAIRPLRAWRLKHLAYQTQPTTDDFEPLFLHAHDEDIMPVVKRCDQALHCMHASVQQLRGGDLSDFVLYPHTTNPWNDSMHKGRHVVCGGSDAACGLTYRHLSGSEAEYVNAITHTLRSPIHEI